MLNPGIWNPLSQTSDFVKKTHGIRMKTVYSYYKNHNLISFYETTELEKVSDFIFKKIINNKSYVTICYGQQKEAGKKSIELYKKILDMDLDKKSVKELLDIYRKIKESWLYFDGLNVLPWFQGSDKLSEHISTILRIEYNIPEPDIQLLLTTPEKSFTMDEEAGFLKLLLRVKEKKLEPLFSKEKLIRTDLPEDILEGINELAKAFHWVPFDYDGPAVYDETHYIKQIRLHIDDPFDQITVKIDHIANYEKEMNAKHSELLKRYSVSQHLQRLLSDLYLLTVMTDERKAVHFRLHLVFRNVLESLSTKLSILFLDIKYLIYDEIKEFQNDSARLKKISQTRQDEPFLVYKVEDHDIEFIRGKKMEDILHRALDMDDVDFVKGQVASIGVGTVTGTARLILETDDLPKMKQGDILIATMTTPNLVPAMRKAAAIVTDEGGVTCHAAIVSRELGLPCIIGTDNATVLFKDGDLVEVDAKKGIARKLK